MKERFQLSMQWFFGGNWRLRDLNLRIHARRSGRFSFGADGEDENLLASVIDGKILVRLKEPQFAHAFSGDAAGGEVGHASGVEFESHVSDVDFAGKNRKTDCAHFFYWGIHKRQNDVQIVDHEVEHNINIERARREYAQAVNFEEHWLRKQRNCGANGRIEALEMSDLHDAFVPRRDLDQFVGFRQGSRERLFNQDVDAGFHESAGNGEMMHRRRGDGCGSDFAVRGEHLLDRAEGPAAELACNRICSIELGIDHPHQPHRLTLLFEFFVNAGVVAPKNTHANYRNGDRVVGLQEGFLVGQLPEETGNCKRKMPKGHLGAN